MLPLNKLSSIRTFLFCLVILFLGYGDSGMCQTWNAGEIALLPDSSFALVEIAKGKKIRHCPHHNVSGNLDEEQLIYVLGTFDNEIWIEQANKRIAEKHLTQHYDKFMTRVMKKGLQRPININRARLTELVLLPRVGPVLAVRIVKYRENISSFTTIEQIKKVEGIGTATFNAIKFYITVK
jgi:competence ComEA-like helix-hairpin-helix protein